MGLSNTDKTIFADRGIICLKGLIPKGTAARVKESVISELDRLQLRKNGKLVTSKLSSLPVFQQTSRLSQMVKSGPEVEKLLTDDLLSIIAALGGSTLRAAGATPQLLLSFPHSEQWSLKALNWHLDIAIPKTDVIPGIQAFILIDDLQTRGGGTLALAGSHRLPYLREAEKGGGAHGVRAHRVFSQLFDGSSPTPEKFFSPQVVNGVDVSIVEMSGKAGDVFIMDMRVIHSPSLNSTRNVRMMATTRWIRVEAT